MSHWLRTCALLAASAAGAAVPAHAQGVVMERNISLNLARMIADAALAACRSQGFHTTVAVVDRAGQLLVLLRDEQAGPETVEIAQRKAYTARVFRRTTLDFVQRTMPDQLVNGQRQVTGVIALPGGVPIQVGQETIGGVGSSGSSPETDDACAKAGVAKVADLLK